MAMSKWAALGWAILALATLAIAVAADLLSRGEPQGATVLDRAILLSGDRPPENVSLPHVINPGSGTADTVRYLIDIDPATVRDADPYLLVPWLNRRFSLAIDGDTFYDSRYHTVWAGPAISTTSLVRLPRGALVGGRNRLVLTLEVDRFIVPLYLSRLYLGTDAQLAPVFKRQTVITQLKLMSVAAQVLLAVGLILAFFFRPRDMLIAWLAALEAIATTVSIAMSAGFLPGLREVLPYIVALVPAYGLLLVAVALALLGRRPPRALLLATIAISCLSLACAAIGTPVARTVSAV